jgi:hypothetical protein
MSTVHNEVSIASKIQFDAADQEALVAAVADENQARESWSTVAGRFYDRGVRAEHLRIKGGDADVKALVDRQIALTFSVEHQVLLSKFKRDLTASQKITRDSVIKELANMRSRLTSALANCVDKESKSQGLATPFCVGLAAKLHDMIDKIKDAPTSKLTFNVRDAIDALTNAIDVILTEV